MKRIASGLEHLHALARAQKEQQQQGQAQGQVQTQAQGAGAAASAAAASAPQPPEQQQQQQAEQGTEQPRAQQPSHPFALIGEVTEGSPASEGGLQVSARHMTRE